MLLYFIIYVIAKHIFLLNNQGLDKTQICTVLDNYLYFHQNINSAEFYGLKI